MGWSINAKGITIPEGVVKKIVSGGVTLWQAPSGVVYTPILPDDTSTYPMYLKGWAKYTVDNLTSTASSNTVATIDTGVRGLYPSTCFASSYAGCENTKSLSAQPDKSVKYGYTTDTYRGRVYIKDTDITPTDTAWRAYLAEHPIDILFELETSDDSVWFAVTDGTSYGYYCPASGEFVAVYGMTGTVIQRVEYVDADGGQYIATDTHLTSDDSIETRIYPRTTGRNTAGCFTSSSADDNFCIYVSSTSAGSYTRFDGQVKRNLKVVLDEWNAIKIDKTGSYLNGEQKDIFDSASFITNSPMYVMNLPNSTSSKFDGRFDYIRVPGKLNMLPVKVGNTYTMLDTQKWKFHTLTGTLSGGDVIDESIPFPTEIYEEPVLLMMGGNPFYPPEPEPEVEE